MLHTVRRTSEEQVRYVRNDDGGNGGMRVRLGAKGEVRGR